MGGVIPCPAFLPTHKGMGFPGGKTFMKKTPYEAHLKAIEIYDDALIEAIGSEDFERLEYYRWMLVRCKSRRW